MQSQSIEYRYTVNHCIEISLQQEDGEKLCNFHYNLPSSDRNTFDSRSRYSSLSPSRRGIDWHRIDSHWSWPRALTPWTGRRPIVARFAAPRLVTPTRTSRRGGRDWVRDGVASRHRDVRSFHQVQSWSRVPVIRKHLAAHQRDVCQSGKFK